MNVVQSLYQVQSGLKTSKSFQKELSAQRLSDLKLSRFALMKTCHMSGITSLDLDRVGERYMLSGSKNGDLIVHDLLNTSGRPSYVADVVCQIRSNRSYAHKFGIIAAQWYPFDTGLFVTSGLDQKVKIWDTNSLKPADTFSMNYQISGHNLHPRATTHNLIAVGLRYCKVVLLDPRSGAQCHELVQGHSVGVTSVKWSPSSEYLLASGGMDHKILLWDIRSAKGYLRSLDQDNGEAISRKKDLKTAHDGWVNSMQFSDDGLYLVSYGLDSCLRLWDVALCKNTLVNYGRLCTTRFLPSSTISMAMCCNSRVPLLFVPSDCCIVVYNLFTGVKLRTLVGHFSFVLACLLKETTQELFSGGNDMNLLIWSADLDIESEEDSQSIEEYMILEHQRNIREVHHPSTSMDHESASTRGIGLNTTEESADTDIWTSDED